MACCFDSVMPLNSVSDVHLPLRAWFEERQWQPQPFQRDVWIACARGEDGLLQAPTGSGKTYAAMGHVLSKGAANLDQTPGVKLIWVAPLRALSADIAEAARDMARGLGLDWEVGTRTGDTSAKDKARQRTVLPDILITTPESLHVLIAQKGGVERLSKAQMIVVDEWHELLGSKRGVQVELAVSWLRHKAQLERQEDTCVGGERHVGRRGGGTEST